MVVTVPMSDDGSGNGSVNSNCFLPMTEEQRDWLLAIIDCDQPKMTRILNQHPELAVWKTNINGTALHYAAKYGDCGVIRLLLGNYQVPVDVQTCGMTPLHLAAANGCEDVIFLLTSMYKARTDIRDFRGQLPSAYLPREKEALMKYFPNPLRILLQNCNNYLYLLASQPETGQITSEPISYENNNNDESNESGSVNNLNAPPITSHFPWSQNLTEETIRQLSFSSSLGSVRSRARGSSKDRHKMYKTLPSGIANKMMCFPVVDLKVTNTGSKFPTMKLKLDSPKRIFDSNFQYDDVKLIQNVYAHIRQRRQIASPYNPCNPESTKSSELNMKNCRLAPSNLRSTVGRQLKRSNNSHGSVIKSNTLILTKSLNDDNNNSDSDNIALTDPPTPTN
ncbi:Ankyrin repeat domain-containing protein [Schistosoma japonicum]|nr:Ankyrin repeat domain-containing protein [Schistosoma japonicum]